MFNLIKNNIIQFDKLIINQYSALNLDEVDVIILIRLNDLLQRGERLLSVRAIASSMRINESECGHRIVDMVRRGFITLELAEGNAKEIFGLDETYQRLAFLLENAKEQAFIHEVDERIKNTMRMLEQEMNKTLSPIEMEIISRWYIEKKYSNELIEESIYKALKNKNRNISYIDRLIAKAVLTPKPTKKSDEGESIKELFRKVYEKKR